MSERNSTVTFSPEKNSASYGAFGQARFNYWKWFWIATLVVSLPYAWYCFYVPPNKVNWSTNYDSAQQQASQIGKPIILFITGKWCVPCRIMKRTVWADEEVSARVNSSYVALLVDVDSPESANVLKRFQVSVTPSTIITDSQGNLLLQKQGGVGKQEFLELLSQTPILEHGVLPIAGFEIIEK